MRIPSHYHVYSEPPDKDGEETLHVISAQRRFKFKGRSFREFTQRVVPLLDGHRTFEEVHDQVRDLFDAEELAEALSTLHEQGLLEDRPAHSDADITEERRRTQWNAFHDVCDAPEELQQRLANSRVTLFGLTPVGVAAARSLAAAGLGELCAVDFETVAPSDSYFNPEFGLSDCGRRRTEVFRPECPYKPIASAITDDAGVEDAIAGSAFVINALDEGHLSLMYRLNRVCVRTRTPFISAAATGFEITVGPTVYPEATACYMCYRMRLIACATNPEASFNHESYLDRRKRDDSGRSANFVFGTAIAGQLAAAEVVKALTGIAHPATKGRVQVLDLRALSSTHHVVLRKPWCPACGEPAPTP